MLTAVSTWVCLCVCVCGVSSSPVGPRSGEQEVLKDDVNVLMYGVLQFGESLHHMYQNTEAKLQRITNAITHTESVVQRLGRDTEQTIRSERQIKDRLGVIQAETTQLQANAKQTRGLVSNVQRDEEALKQKLAQLDETIKRFTPESIRALKETTRKHSTLLHDLGSWTEKQKQQLESQNQQLAALQKRTNASV